MIIDLKNTDETVLPDFKGGEKEMVARIKLYSCMYYNEQDRIADVAGVNRGQEQKKKPVNDLVTLLT